MFFFLNDTATTEIYTRSLVAASDVYKRQISADSPDVWGRRDEFILDASVGVPPDAFSETGQDLSLIHISEPTRPY